MSPGWDRCSRSCSGRVRGCNCIEPFSRDPAPQAPRCADLEDRYLVTPRAHPLTSCEILGTRRASSCLDPSRYVVMCSSPGRYPVGGTVGMTAPVALHSCIIGTTALRAATGRRAERAKADNDNVLIDDFRQGWLCRSAIDLFWGKLPGFSRPSGVSRRSRRTVRPSLEPVVRPGRRTRGAATPRSRGRGSRKRCPWLSPAPGLRSLRVPG